MVERVVKFQYKDILVLSQFLSMLSYFMSQRGFPFIVNTFENVAFQTFYNKLMTYKFTYLADYPSKEKQERKRKKS